MVCINKIVRIESAPNGSIGRMYLAVNSVFNWKFYSRSKLQFIKCVIIRGTIFFLYSPLLLRLTPSLTIRSESLIEFCFVRHLRLRPFQRDKVGKNQNENMARYQHNEFC